MVLPLRRDEAGAGFLAGLAAVAASYLAVGPTVRFLLVPLADAIIVVSPGPVAQFAIATLGNLAKPMVLAGAGAIAVGVIGALVVAVLRLARLDHREWAEAVFGAGAVTTAFTFLVTISLLSAVAAGLAAGLVVAVVGRGITDDAVSVGRRRALGAAGVALGIGTVGALRGASAGRSEGAPDPAAIDDEQVSELLSIAADRSLSVDGLEGLLSSDFYTVDINSVPPEVDPDGWQLGVGGEVDRQLALDFETFRDYEAEHRFVSLRCVSDPLNGYKLDTALWTGIPVSTILEEAGAPDTCCVYTEAADDYYQAFTREALDDALLAYRMNGQPLPTQHGFPVRLLTPGHWGEINVKWITDLRVTEEEQDGYWEKRGWHGTGPVNTIAKLHHIRADLGQVTVAGHAYAGVRGIDRVEVSTDGGDSWTEATLSETLPGRVPADGDTVDPESVATDAWRMWRHGYEASEDHELVVRAVDGGGTVQPDEESEPFPSGATGWVSETVRP